MYTITCRSDRIRLINFDRRIAALVKGVILQFFQTKVFKSFISYAFISS